MFFIGTGCGEISYPNCSMDGCRLQLAGLAAGLYKTRVKTLELWILRSMFETIVDLSFLMISSLYPVRFLKFNQTEDSWQLLGLNRSAPQSAAVDLVTEFWLCMFPWYKVRQYQCLLNKVKGLNSRTIHFRMSSLLHGSEEYVRYILNTVR